MVTIRRFRPETGRPLCRVFGPHLLVWALVACGTTVADADWKAGTGRVVITPDKPLWMAGYGGRDHPVEGQLTDLWAKALVLEDGAGRRGVLVTLDLVGVGRSLSQSLCEQLAATHGLQRSQIAICCSHTHTGPVVGRNLSPLHYLLLDPQQQQWIDEYANSLREKVVEVVGQALQDLEPSRLSWGNGCATFAVNRRANREGDVPTLRTAGALTGPQDHDVPVLAVHKETGELTAVVFGYACHATVLSFYQWSGDYPGFAQTVLEANHPGCTALFWAGCGADQNPLPRRTVVLAQHYGQRLADAVDTVLLTTQMTPVADTLGTAYREVELAFERLPTREELTSEAQSPEKFVAARAKMLLAQIDAGQTLRATYSYPVEVWRLGDDVTFVILGGEVVVDYALCLKSRLSGPRTWVAGYSNDVMAYIPSQRVWQEGGYEGADAMVYYGLPARWAAGVEETIVQAVAETATAAAQGSGGN